MKTVAIIPTPEFREALLGNGPCESRAPCLAKSVGLDWQPSSPRHRPLAKETALPLLWEGKPVPDGIARAARALARQHGLGGGLATFEPVQGDLKAASTWCLKTTIGRAVHLTTEPVPIFRWFVWRGLALCCEQAGIAAKVVTNE